MKRFRTFLPGTAAAIVALLVLAAVTGESARLAWAAKPAVCWTCWYTFDLRCASHWQPMCALEYSGYSACNGVVWCSHCILVGPGCNVS